LVANLANLTLYYTPAKIAVAISSFFIAGYLAGRIPAWMVAKQDIIKAIWG
jgi:ABC-type antimicrobial peptide transport system permease subunit